MKKLVRFLAITLFVSTFSQPLFAAADANASANANNNPSDMAANATTTSDTTNTNSTTTTTNTAANNTNNKKLMSMSNLLQQLQRAGYIVKSAELNKDDAQYKVDAIDKHGDSQSLQINANTGLTPDQKKTPHEVPVTQVVKKLETNGSYVKSFTTDSNGYKATVVDNKGNEKDVTIDPKTGKVSS